MPIRKIDYRMEVLRVFGDLRQLAKKSQGEKLRNARLKKLNSEREIFEFQIKHLENYLTSPKLYMERHLLTPTKLESERIKLAEMKKVLERINRTVEKYSAAIKRN